jgi:hypothetical protein
MSQAEYQHEWGNRYKRPGWRTRFCALILRVFPKAGPFRALGFDQVPAAAEKMFLESLDRTLIEYRALLAAQRRGTLRLQNENFDTGGPLKPGSYRLADEAYAKLLEKLEGKPVPAELRGNILTYYADLDAPFETKSDKKEWRKVLARLAALKAANSAATSQ